MADARALTVVFAVLVAAGTCGVQARVQDYQIIRLITYKTECQPGTLERLPPKGRALRFFADCANATFYPNGVEIVCDEQDDDRSCHVLTHPQTFDHLHALDPDR